MRTASQRRRRAGLTLTEVIVSVVLVALMIGGVYAGLMNAVSLNYASAQRVAAFGLCRQKLEAIRATAYADVTAANLTSESVFLTHLGGSRRVPITGTRSCAVVDRSNPTRKDVTVSLSWAFRNRTFQESVSGTVYDKG
jgi:Tfp pilus assembly protein PilV